MEQSTVGELYIFERARPGLRKSQTGHTIYTQTAQHLRLGFTGAVMELELISLLKLRQHDLVGEERQGNNGTELQHTPHLREIEVKSCVRVAHVLDVCRSSSVVFARK